MMTDRPTTPRTDEAQPPAGDPDDGSTWNTIDGTAEIEDLMDEDEMDDFLVEPIPDPLANPLDMSNS